MTHRSLLCVAALMCGSAFAQAPAGTTPRTPQESNATSSGGAPAAKAETKVDAKKGAAPMSGGGGAMPMASGGSHASMMKKMDANGDGMVSKKEWDRHHASMWSMMKNNKGMVPMADMEAMMKGGPN